MHGRNLQSRLKQMRRIISLRVEVCGSKSCVTPPLLLKFLLQARKVSDHCRGIDYASVHDLSAKFWNCSVICLLQIGSFRQFFRSTPSIQFINRYNKYIVLNGMNHTHTLFLFLLQYQIKLTN